MDPEITLGSDLGPDVSMNPGSSICYLYQYAPLPQWHGPQTLVWSQEADQAPIICMILGGNKSYEYHLRPECHRAMDPDTALGISPDLDDTMALGDVFSHSNTMTS